MSHIQKHTHTRSTLLLLNLLYYRNQSYLYFTLKTNIQKYRSNRYFGLLWLVYQKKHSHKLTFPQALSHIFIVIVVVVVAVIIIKHTHKHAYTLKHHARNPFAKVNKIECNTIAINQTHHSSWKTSKKNTLSLEKKTWYWLLNFQSNI